jgi:hypothetical protein
MRSFVLVCAAVLPACYVQESPRNGLDGELAFQAWFENVAVGATNRIAVSRDGLQWCFLGKTGGCDAPSTTPITIDALSCGAGCNATIESDSRLIDVVASTDGDHELNVTVHAVDGSGTWTDRFPLHATRATALALTPEGHAIGAAYAAEIGARTALGVCPTTAVTGELACLGGDYPTTITITGDAASPTVSTLAHPDYFMVELTRAGTATVRVDALGMTRTQTFRAAAPAEWQRIAFAPFELTPGMTQDVGTTFLGAPTSEIAFADESPPLAVTAVLADGTRALLSPPRLACQPAGLLTAFASPEWNGAGPVVFKWLQAAPQHATATCAVSGYEALGGITLRMP